MGLTSEEALGAAISYVKKTLVGMGALKGANCQIQSITYDSQNLQTEVVFLWKDTENVNHTSTAILKDGNSVSNGEIDDLGHLLLRMNNGTTIDCGLVTGEAKLKEQLKATTVIGTVTKGKVYPEGTDLEVLIRDILISYAAPGVVLTTTPNTKLYDIVSDSLATILLKAAVTKNTDDVTKVQFFAGETLVNEVTTGVAGGGNFQFQYTPASAIRSDITFKATATDGKQSTSSTFSIKFVAKSYYGLCDANVSDPDETVIKSGTPNLKDTRNLTYSGITTNWGKVFYAYPKSFGALTYIKDEINNINYFDSFQRSEIQVDGIDYYCYTLINPTAAEDNQITFK